MFATTGHRLEDLDIGDFIDVVYSYSIAGNESREGLRSATLGYIFDYSKDIDFTQEDQTFDGFAKKSLSMLDELDSFGQLD